MRVLHFIDNVLSKIEMGFIILLFSGILILAMLQILLRAFFSTGLFFTNEFVQHGVFWVGFVGAGLATQQRRHINIDALSRLLTDQTKKVVDVILDIVAAGICILLVYASIQFIRMESEFGGNSASLKIPVWCLELVIPFTFGVSSFRFLLHALNNIIELVKEKKDDEAASR